MSDLTDYSALYKALNTPRFEKWLTTLPAEIEDIFARHGDIERWTDTLSYLPNISAENIDLDNDCITVTSTNTDHKMDIDTLFRDFHPWRKGPLHIHGVDIDTEWRSDWKWQRLKDHITPLAGRTVLDVGCGNGYHCWRMAGAGAELVIGIDPTMVFVMQFHAIQHFIKNPQVHVLPLTLEKIPTNLRAFDTVFSMGVLSHRRSPMDHLIELKSSLRSGGELVLETLVIEGGENTVMVPEGCYAKMRNAWFIPSSITLMSWMKRCGYTNIQLVDETQTSIEEQRATDWMHFESLTNFLDPNNPDLSIEGLPAPRRAIIIANSP